MVTRCPSVLQLLPEYFRTPVNKPHTLTERENALMALEKEEITEKISSPLHLKGLF